MSEPAITCPDPVRLAAFSSGELADNETSVLVEHVEACPDCRGRVAELERRDPLLAAMRIAPDAAGVDMGLPKFLTAIRKLGAVGSRTGEDAVRPGGKSGQSGTNQSATRHVQHFEVLRELGVGGMATVYLAKDARLGREIALKCPKVRWGSSVERLEREARSLAQLDHPNICPIYDVNLNGEEPYLALKYIKGETLSDRLRAGAVTPEQAAEWCLTIADALQTAHDKGIVHRDLKPGNLMLDSAGTLWLMDFGLSKLMEPSVAITEEGHSPGTPGYMAPEQISSRFGEVGPRTDVFSLGVLLYELLTGERPFQGPRHEIAERTMHGEQLPPSRRKPGLDPRWDAVCAKALAKRTSARFASAKEFAAAIRDVLQPTTTSPEPAPAPKPAEKGAVNRRPWVIAAASIAMLGIAYWGLRPPGQPDAIPNGAPPTGDLVAKTTPPVSGPHATPPAAEQHSAEAPVPAEMPPTAPPAAPPTAPTETPKPEPVPESKPSPAPTPPATPPAEQPAPVVDTKLLAQSGVAFLEKYCFACHANDKKYPGLDMRDRVTLLRPADPNEKPFLVPGKPEESRLWEQLADGLMPPSDQPQPSEAELASLKQWIAAGAEFPAASRPTRPFVGEQSVLAIIDKDLFDQPESKRQYLRYLSLAHLWNSDVSDEHLRLVRAAVSKLMNSLSSESQIVPPHVVDADGLVLRIDLNDYGWRAGQQWLEVAKAYPYGIKAPGEAYRRVTEMTGDFPYVRADWFVYSAARPPLYHALLTFPDQVGLPESQSTLERLLAVDPVRNYEKDLLKRAAFTGEASGVSDHNRMVERHSARYGYYWPSYDFFGDTGRQSLFRFPLGPKRLAESDEEVFQHDGGELIFSLPNGLQGYMLVTSDGTRIDKGPQEIVRDANQHAGSYDIVNGISCMGCHRHGMVRFADSLRLQYLNRTGDVADKVLRLYPEQADMSRLVEGDRKRFLSALDEAIGPFLRVGPHATTSVEEFPEPITSVARPYDRTVKLADVARELGLPADAEAARSAGLKCSAAELATVIGNSSQLRDKLGLGPLADGDSLPRKAWENVFGRTARELGLGSPLTAN
jgi:serine/threonine protein kinase